MKYRYIHISAALFLVAGMAVQFVLSYQQALRNVQENIDLKTQVAHEKILFELYDAYEVIDLMKQYVEENLWFIIGDVSGKGVPAALFMSAAVNSEDEFVMGGDRLVYTGQIDEILELKETHNLVASDHPIRSMNEINKNYELRIGIPLTIIVTVTGVAAVIFVKPLRLST